MKDLTILAIETSCDETACALVKNGREVLKNEVFTQIDIHREYGGVVPEIASRNHVLKLPEVVGKCLNEHYDAIAVTQGPGLAGALICGVSYAKALAYAQHKPLIAVNHIEGHISANYISHPTLTPPFLCLVVSGGHTMIVLVEDFCTYTCLGQTRDDAAGEAIDKVSRVLGLPYPGGPELEKLALEGNPKAIRFHSAFNEGEGLDMSFSGLKTAVVNYMHTMEQKGEAVCRADVAASFQYEVNSILSDKAVRAAHGTLALAGGVSANRNLRGMLEEKCRKKGIRFCCPAFKYCTDNAAMIGSAAFYLLMQGHVSGLDINAVPYLPIA